MSSLLVGASLLRRGAAGLSALMGYLAGWSYVAAALFITFDILARNFLGFSSSATVEITGYILACGIAWALAHALAARAHIRVDVLVSRFPMKLRAPLHLFALSLLGGFALFCAWAAWSLVDESLLFDAHDNSALRIAMVIPQGIWLAGLVMFVIMVAALLLESLAALLAGEPARLDTLLASRSFEDETAEALDAVGMARE
ncbi:TRAP transporter small permease subunit [Rhodovarius crocodyli]|uniref:TRAP transporter small permease subunit n=1 Tax=Rhodovarius crocodyli TaxID=1979269 RepID=UPI0013E2DFC9|nr:TRAP transporter small permease subunit [Rhodovarius crocodyli]